MTRKQWSVVAVTLVALAVAAGSPAAAQETPGTIAQVVVTRVRPGMGKQYQEGRKRHLAWHKRQGDPWSWHTWQVTSGPDTGHYVTVTFGHHWKDFDTWETRFGEGDDADVELNLAPHSEATTVAYFDLLADVSRPPASPTPARMSEVVHFFLKPGQVQQFRHAIRRAHEAIGKTSWPEHYFWYELWNGGEGPHFVLVLPRGSWADMAEPEVSFPAMLTKAFGPYEAGAILDAFGQASKSQSSEVLRYRPDLSHVASP
ncbi:MAG TPA: hypothetical protein VLI67_11050 [Vicinamibacteria bacterium]|nr:hypothetical protein [Vicinamibacteria bacterium]